MFISVVLPAPFSPTSAWISPARIETEASWIATRSPNLLAICSMLTTSAPAMTLTRSALGKASSPTGPLR